MKKPRASDLKHILDAAPELNSSKQVYKKERAMLCVLFHNVSCACLLRVQAPWLVYGYGCPRKRSGCVSLWVCVSECIFEVLRYLQHKVCMSHGSTINMSADVSHAVCLSGSVTLYAAFMRNMFHVGNRNVCGYVSGYDCT